LIKTPIPFTFILEWFLKFLNAPISKDVVTSRFTTEQEAIFKAQHLDLIYAQYGMLYHLLPDALWSTYNPRQNPGPHADGIVVSANVISTDSMTSHLKELSLKKFVGGPTSSLSSNPTQSTDVLSMQSPTNPNGNQKLGRNKKKGRNNCKGGKNGNKPKDNENNEKMNNNAREGKRERRKVKFPYNLFIDDHLTHLYPKLEKVARLLSLSPVVLANTFPHNQHMASSSLNTGNVTHGSQNPLLQDGDRLCINMVDEKINVATRSRDYSSSKAIPSLESPPPPPETNL
jgi:hypothetical protein